MRRFSARRPNGQTFVLSPPRLDVFYSVLGFLLIFLASLASAGTRQRLLEFTHALFKDLAPSSASISIMATSFVQSQSLAWPPKASVSALDLDEVLALSSVPPCTLSPSLISVLAREYS